MTKPPSVRHGASSGPRKVRIDLPEFGLCFLPAVVVPGLETSRLEVGEAEPIELDGEPGYRFRVYPLVNDARTFVLAEAPCATSERLGRRIRTSVALDGRTVDIELELIPRRRRGCLVSLADAVTVA